MGRFAPSPFHVYANPDGALVVRGELDMGTVDELQAKIDQVSVRGVAMVLDLTQLSFLDSAGIHCIVDTFLATGHPVVLKNVSPAIRPFLDLVESLEFTSPAWTFDGEEAVS